jgi:hypothetical protein
MAHTSSGEGLSSGTGIGMQDCIENCTDCHQVCLETIEHCLKKGGRHASAEHVRLLTDCAQICQTSADFMTRGSNFHQATCRTCAELCRACAKTCRELGGPEMESCADQCDRCAESCEAMAIAH